MSENPLVSIIIPTYNRAHLIGETLDSVLAQTYPNWECIIVDDGSTDNTDEVVGAYVKKDARFKYFHRPDEHLPGGNGARNYGFKMSQGEYVNWLDSDDLFSENKIEEQIKVALKENADIITCKWGMFCNSNKEVFENLKVYKNYTNSFHFFEDLYANKGYFTPHVYLVKYDFLSKTNQLWHESLRINQDGVMFTLLIQQAKKICYSKNGICYYRQTRSDSTSLLNDKKIFQFISTVKLIEEMHKIVYNGRLPETFKNYKWRSYLRIPREFYKELKTESHFFSEEMKRQRKSETLKKKLKLFLKQVLR